MAADAVGGILLASVTLYAVLGGADFGGGLWDLLAGGTRRGRAPRALIDETITPVWEANHVWLVFDLVIFWTAFPHAFAAVMVATAPPLWIAVAGIVARGAGFAFRKEITRLSWQRAMGAVFAFSSFLTPFFMGTVIGAIAVGAVPANPAGASLSAWTSATAVLTGFLFVAACGYLAAVYLVGEAERRGDGAMRRYFARRAQAAAIVAGALSLAALAELHGANHALYARLTGRALPLVIAAGVCGLAVFALLAAGRVTGPRAIGAAGVACVVWGWGVAQYPVLLPGTGVTLSNAGAPAATLDAVVVLFIIAVAVIGPSFVLLFIMQHRRLLGGDGPPTRLLEAEPAPAGIVEILGPEPAGPGPLVVLGREVARAGAGAEGFPDAGRVSLVAGAPRRGRDVHDVSPALLVRDRRDAVDHVAVPPDRITGPHVGDAADRGQQRGMPPRAGGERAADRDAAHVVVGHVGEQRAQHEVGHRAGDGHGVQHALVAGHVGQRGPALEGAEGGAHRDARILRRGAPVGRVPRIVLLDTAIEQVPERLLVALDHPQVESARVAVRAQAGRIGARRPAADPVRIQEVPAGVEPLLAVRFVLPETVEEHLHPGHPVILPGFHLRGRPVDRVDLGLGIEAGEELVAGAAVVTLEEPVALDVVDDVAVPGQGLVAAEVPAHDQAAAAAQQPPRLVSDRPGLDVRVVDDRPDRLAALPHRGDLVDLGPHLPLHDGEDFLDRAAGGGDPLPERRLELADRGREVGGRLLPVR
jgi:cytochrome bd ubiquinol oxidase subunit II